MRKTISILLLIAAFGAFLQVEARSNQTITVQINRQKTLPKSNLTIKFLALLEDSRCPTDAQCIQAGTARIKVEIKKAGGKPQIFELNTSVNPQPVSFAGYRISLIDVNPKPATNIRIDRNGYAATFDVVKK